MRTDIRPRIRMFLALWLAAAIGIVAAALPMPAAAQTFEDPPSPGAEPGTFDLPERSDLGNVVQSATGSYNSGIRRMKAADKLRSKLDGMPEAKHEKALARIRSNHEAASQDFIQAIQSDGTMLRAYAGLGAALRELGQPAEALKAHAAALKQNPDDPENFGGWAQSLLALNMLGDATVAYSKIAQSKPERAAQLMDVIKAWLEEKQRDPGDLDPAHVERMAQWIAEQST